MTNLTHISQEQTMSSIDLREIVNQARMDHGESEVRNNVFLKRIEDELGGEIGVAKVCKTPTEDALDDITTLR